jgi:hypothetical protein
MNVFVCDCGRTKIILEPPVSTLDAGLANPLDPEDIKCDDCGDYLEPDRGRTEPPA